MVDACGLKPHLPRYRFKSDYKYKVNSIMNYTALNGYLRFKFICKYNYNTYRVNIYLIYKYIYDK